MVVPKLDVLVRPERLLLAGVRVEEPLWRPCYVVPERVVLEELHGALFYDVGVVVAEGRG